MAKRSAGLLVFRRRRRGVQVFLVHPGGPFWAKKDIGSWSVPKGEPARGEDALPAARREFTEETGQTVDGAFTKPLPCRQANRKEIVAWAVEGEIDETAIVSNACTIEWPPCSGRRMEIPEVDRGAWFALATAKRKINPGQAPLLDALVATIGKPKRREPSAAQRPRSRPRRAKLRT